MLLVAGYLAVVWAIALTYENTRNARFLVVLLGLSLVFLAAGLAPGATAPVRAGVIAVTTSILAVPDWFGIGSTSRDDRRFVRTILSASRQPTGHADAAAASEEIRAHIGAATAKQSPLRVAALRLLERALLLESGRLESDTLVLPVQAPMFRASSRAYLGEISRGRTLRARSPLRPWHEDHALRAYMFDFRDEIPAEALRPGPVALGGWVDRAQKILEQLASLPIRDGRLIEIHRELVRLLETELEIRTGDQSTESDARYQAIRERLDATWQLVLADLQVEANASIG